MPWMAGENERIGGIAGIKKFEIFYPLLIFNFNRNFLLKQVADKANITPAVIKWARETAHMSLEAASSKVSVQPDRLSQWETGALQPTIRQAEALAKAYKRPFAFFFLPQPPRDFMPLQDFRRKTAGPLTTASVFIIREMQQRQAWARDFYEESDELTLPFVGRFTIGNSPTVVAQDILKELEIDPRHYQQASPMKEWTEKSESKGVFISRTSYINSHLLLNSEEFQGFAIADPLVPFIFINSDDWDSAQLFSLVHELAHIWINQSGISSEISPEIGHANHQHPVETFCNQVAAQALLPDGVINALPERAFDDITEVYNNARRFGVSSFALLVRGLEIKRISFNRYRELKKDADEAYNEYLHRYQEKVAKQKERGSRPNPYRVLANRVGHLFVRSVLDAFR
ncbi:MAG TPA: XRE family transcriptional regulator, partial [Puia sp.]